MSGCAPTTEAESTAHYRRPVSNHYFDRFNCSRAEQQLHSAPNPGNYYLGRSAQSMDILYYYRWRSNSSVIDYLIASST